MTESARKKLYLTLVIPPKDLEVYGIDTAEMDEDEIDIATSVSSSMHACKERTSDHCDKKTLVPTAARRRRHSR